MSHRTPALREVVAYCSRAISFFIFLASLLGSPGRLNAQTTPILLFAGETNRPAGSKVIDMSSGNSVLTGGIHCNSDIDVSGTGNFFRTGVVEHVTGVDPAPDFPGKVTLQNCPVIASSVTGWPVYYWTNDFAPGSQEAVAAQAAGKYFHVVGDTDLSAFISGGVLREGLYYVEGKVHLSKGGLTGHVTVVATKEITVSGTGENWLPYTRCLLFFSARALSYHQPAVNISGGSSRWEGVIFAPNAGVQISGSGNVVPRGALVARGIHLSGGSLNLTGMTFTDCPSAGATNQPPIVDAGGDQAITFPTNTVTLNGSVSDDGLPNGTWTAAWSTVSGPESVVFSLPSTTNTQPTTTATFSAAGTYVLRLTAGDGQLTSSDDVIVTVDRENHPPQALPQSVVSDEDTSTNITLQGIDADGDPLSYTVTALPSHGTLTLDSQLSTNNSVYTYAPETNYNGADQFTFKVSDGILESSNATVAITIRPINDPPVADAISLTTNEDTSVTITLSGSDADGDALTYRVIAGPTNGTLSGPLTGSLTGTNGALTYLPNTNFFGEDQLTYVLNDGTTDSAPKPVTLTIVPVNDLPMVDAGPDQIIVLPTSAVSLAGTVIYDAYPGTVDTVQWAMVSGPGSVTFSDASNEVTSAAFSTNGVYVLRLTASDSFLTGSDDVIVTVDAPPVVTAGPAQTNTLPATIQLNGTVTDDGLPTNDVLSIEWSKVSGPGSVVFSDPNTPATTAAFSQSGVYVLRLTANDGAAAASSNVIVLVNQAPLVDAGSARVITNLETVLTGTVFDDGLPNGYFITTWSKVSGPGMVEFSQPTETNSQPTTTATFSQTGVYVLQLTADDSLVVSSNQVTISVDAAPTVNAGNDQLITFPATAALTATASDDGIPEGSSLAYQWTQVSGPGAVTFGDGAALSTTASFSQPGAYVLQFSASDSLLNSADEVTVTVNQAPVVNAGPDAQAILGVSILLQGTVQDDGVPTNGTLTATWTIVGGPGNATLVTPDTPITQASFDAEGTYVLRLTASDSLATSSDDITIVVTRPNLPPAVSAGPKQLVTLPAAANLIGSVMDDGLPVGVSVSIAWSKVSGPGTVSFSSPNSTNTSASFGDAGDYVLRLTASDTEFTNSSDVQVKVRTAAMNQAPVVDAGVDLVVGLTNVAVLQGKVTDDGLPEAAAVTAGWSLVSGPGTVTFDNSGLTNARATFSAVGTYVLRLAASDSALSASDDVSVTVYPYNQPPVVDAGPDQTITIPDPAVVTASGLTPTNGNTELSISLTDVAHWDFAVGNPGLQGGLWVFRNGLAASEGNVFAAGDFSLAGDLPPLPWDGATNTSARGLARWDGAAWHPFYDPRPIALPDPPGSTPGSHTGMQGTHILFGTRECFGFEFCNENLIAVGARGSNVFGSGSFKELAAVSDGLFDSSARWDGTGWQSWTPEQNVYTPWVIRVTDKKVYLGGQISVQATNSTPLTITNLPWTYGIITWDGTNWEALGSGITDIHDTPSSNPSVPNVTQTYVSAMAVATNGDVYAAGMFTMLTPTGYATNIVKWNNQLHRWEPLGLGIQGNLFTSGGALALAENGDLYVGGVPLTSAGGIPVHNIARWDGNRWWPIMYGTNEGVSDGVVAITTHGRDVYIAGRFTQAGGVPAWRFARWDGQFWHSMGASFNDSFNGSTLALASDDTGVYIGGDFSRVGTNIANKIVKWAFPQPPPRVAILNGHVSDDGLPMGAPLTATWTKVTGPGDVTFADPNSPATTAAFTQAGTYLLRLSANDTEFTTLDEATIVVNGNKPPTINAGADQVINLADSVMLQAAVSDDGLPQGVGLAYVWSVVNGPGTVTFDNPTGTNSTVHFSAGGTYVLRFSANDSQFTVFDDVTFTVLDGTQDNEPPSVNTGSTRTTTYGTVLTLTPTALFDDGKPVGVTNILWAQLSGPGVVTFGNPTNATTTAAFSAPGTYFVRLNANDAELASYMDLRIDVNMPGANTAPKVNAGPTQTLTNQLTTLLTGSVSDDGLPVGVSLNVFWSLGFGPTGGTVTFANSNSPVTAATFSKPGNYALDLNASDGQFTVSSRVFVNMPNQPPVPNAGPDRTITQPTLSLLLTGSATDDGQPSPLTATWVKDSGPGTVSFSSATSITNTVTFGSTGTYVLRLFVFDGSFSVSDFVTVVIASTNNLPPTVSAGTGIVITWPSNSVVLNGVISDDGLPSGITLANWSEFSGPGAVTFSQTTFSNAQPVTTATFSQPGSYVLRLTGTDLALTNASDIIVRVVLPNPANQPPVVDAGSDQTIVVTNTLALAGDVTDDGNPYGSVVSAFWSKVSGPGPVYFGSFTNLTTNVVTSVRFPIPGQYVLRLSASDSVSSTSDEVTITVLTPDPNLAPAVSAGPDVTVSQYSHESLNASVSDDGLPSGFTAVGWSVISGPGRGYFDNAAALNTPVTFYLTGTYVLRLTATDGHVSAFDDVTVTVVPPVNDGPIADPGGDLTVVRPNAALLLGAVYDDGLPFGYPLTYQWSKVSGPGTVTFLVAPESGGGGVTVNNTTQNATFWEPVDGVDALAFATFSTNGEYVLSLTATDTEFTNTATTTITVLPGTNSPPVVNAGPDFIVALPDQGVLVSDVTDDGLEQGWIEMYWSAVSGPGPVWFSTLNGTYRATFITPGEYVLRLTAHDGSLTNHDDVTVTVYDTPPPTAEIHSPLDGGIVTSPTNVIGTASSELLQSYVLEYRLKPGDSDLTPDTSHLTPWSVLASNTVSVVSNALGQLDPTLSLNGIYELRLTATDLIGRSVTTEPITVIFDRNLKIGQFTISFNDLAIPVPGLPLQVTRTYDSRAAAAGIQGDFGIGWTMDIRNVRLQKNRPLGRNWVETTTGSPFDLSLAYHLNPINQRIVTITFPDGRVEKFRFDPLPLDQPLLPIGYPQWRFTPLGNTRGTLVPAGFDDPDGNFLAVIGSIPGTVQLFDLNFFFESLGSNITEEELNRYPTLFRYTTPEGYRYLIDEVDGLQSLTDPNGNTLIVSTNGLTWNNPNAGTNTLSIAFQRDPQGRITNIVDAAGHAMSYGYDATGNLTTFVDRVGQTNGFAYTNVAFPHYLTSISDARGITPMSVEYDNSGRLVRNTDAYGNSIQYLNDVTNLTAGVIDRNGSQVTQEFDADGNLIRAVDAMDGVTTFTYDELGRRLSRTNALGETEHYFYNPDTSALIALVNALGETNTFTYNDQGQITRATERDGTPLSADYDLRNNVTRVADTLGNATVYAYNSLGKPTYSRDALGNEVHSSYDAFGNLSRATNALGYVSEFAYDSNNRITLDVRTRTVNGTTQRQTNAWVYDAAGRVGSALSPDGSVQQTVYDGAGHIVATIDELGRATTNQYDLLGRLVQVIYPDGTSEGYGYDVGDRKVTMTNRLGQATRFVYDPLNRPVITIFPDGTGTTNFYDAASRLVATTDARGNTTWFGHDALGRVIATTNALGEVARFTYDARGNQITSADALGHTTTNVFDLANRLTAVLYPDGSSSSTRYDALGRKISETDQATNSTCYGYDALSRLTSVTNALGYVTRYEYNELGEQTAQIDASGRITRYEYDVRGRRVSRILPLGQSDLAAYDDLGNMISYRDFNGNTTTYQYDPLNRLVAKLPDSRLGEPNVTFGYNSLGQRTNMVDASGVTAYRYDERNRLIEKATPQGTLTYTYDANGNVLSIHSSNANGVAVTYEYDALNRLNAVNDANLGRTGYSYDAAGNLLGFACPNLVHTAYAYDSLNRLTNVTGSTLLNTLAGYAYTLNASGHRASVTEANGRVVNYAYDLLYQLTSETVSGSPNTGSATYSYDSVGNRLARNSNLPGILASSYAYDANDRLFSDLYDNNGNTRSASLIDPISNISTPVSDQYDFENRLTDRNNGQIRVIYDGDGNRVRKIVTTATNTVTTYYLVDDLNPSGYPQVMEELTRDSGNPQLSTPAVTRIYVWGHTLISQDRLDGVHWRPSYYGYDGQGSVRYLTDLNGFVTDTFDYDAFGNLVGRTGDTPNNYLYQGEQYDQDLKLYYLRARYADPDRGRFWTMDSFEGFGTDPQSLHKFTYCHNNPINMRDPSGHMTLTEIMTVVVEAPIVRGALLALQQSMLTCRLQSAAMAGIVGGGVGGALSMGVTAIVQAYTGQWNRDELLEAFSEGFAEGSMAGLAMGLCPFTAGAYLGYSAFIASMDFWRDWNNPDVPTWMKYAEAANMVAATIPLLGPGVARRLNQMLQIMCFPAETQVGIENGTKAIEEIRESDLVFAQNDKTGEIMLKRVKQVFLSVATAMVVLHCGTNTLEATPEHPFWIVDEGYKSADQIQVGDSLISRFGDHVVVTDIAHKQGQFTVYNLEVEDAHSYFAGNQQVLVHNKCDLFKIKSLFGKTQSKVLREAPPNWKKMPVDTGNGWKLLDENGIERVRFMRPNKDAINFQHEKTGYWRWKNEAGEFLDVDGKVVDRALVGDAEFHARTHIPYSGVD